MSLRRTGRATLARIRLYAVGTVADGKPVPEPSDGEPTVYS